MFSPSRSPLLPVMLVLADPTCSSRDRSWAICIDPWKTMHVPVKIRQCNGCRCCLGIKMSPQNGKATIFMFSGISQVLLKSLSSPEAFATCCTCARKNILTLKRNFMMYTPTVRRKALRSREACRTSRALKTLQTKVVRHRGIVKANPMLGAHLLQITISMCNFLNHMFLQDVLLHRNSHSISTSRRSSREPLEDINGGPVSFGRDIMRAQARKPSERMAKCMKPRILTKVILKRDAIPELNGGMLVHLQC